MLQKKKFISSEKQLKKRILKKKYLSILDFGCGNIEDCGRYILNKKDFYLGFDIHKESIDYAKKNIKQKKLILQKKYLIKNSI